MRNGVRQLTGRCLAVAGLVPAVALAGAGVAAAAETPIESRVPVALDGPVATLAILLGLGGLVAGLWRHRRRVAQEARLKAQEAATLVEGAPAATQV